MSLQSVGSIIMSTFPLTVGSTDIFEYNGYVLCPLSNNDYLLNNE